MSRLPRWINLARLILGRWRRLLHFAPLALTYAGCMTARCKRTGKKDPPTGLSLVQCDCLVYTGPYQVGTELSGNQCDLKRNHLWSAVYTPPPRQCLYSLHANCRVVVGAPTRFIFHLSGEELICREFCLTTQLSEA